MSDQINLYGSRTMPILWASSTPPTADQELLANPAPAVPSSQPVATAQPSAPAQQAVQVSTQTAQPTTQADPYQFYADPNARVALTLGEEYTRNLPTWKKGEQVTNYGFSNDGAAVRSGRFAEAIQRAGLSIDQFLRMDTRAKQQIAKDFYRSEYDLLAPEIQAQQGSAESYVSRKLKQVGMSDSDRIKTNLLEDVGRVGSAVLAGAAETAGNWLVAGGNADWIKDTKAGEILNDYGRSLAGDGADAVTMDNAYVDDVQQAVTRHLANGDYYEASKLLITNPVVAAEFVANEVGNELPGTVVKRAGTAAVAGLVATPVGSTIAGIGGSAVGAVEGGVNVYNKVKKILGVYDAVTNAVGKIPFAGRILQDMAKNPLRYLDEYGQMAGSLEASLQEQGLERGTPEYESALEAAKIQTAVSLGLGGALLDNAVARRFFGPMADDPVKLKRALAKIRGEGTASKVMNNAVTDRVIAGTKAGAEAYVTEGIQSAVEQSVLDGIQRDENGNIIGYDDRWYTADRMGAAWDKSGAQRGLSTLLGVGMGVTARNTRGEARAAEQQVLEAYDNARSTFADTAAQIEQSKMTFANNDLLKRELELRMAVGDFSDAEMYRQVIANERDAVQRYYNAGSESMSAADAVAYNNELLARVRELNRMQDLVASQASPATAQQTTAQVNKYHQGQYNAFAKQLEKARTDAGYADDDQTFGMAADYVRSMATDPESVVEVRRTLDDARASGADQIPGNKAVMDVLEQALAFNSNPALWAKLNADAPQPTAADVGESPISSTHRLMTETVTKELKTDITDPAILSVGSVSKLLDRKTVGKQTFEQYMQSFDTAISDLGDLINDDNTTQGSLAFAYAQAKEDLQRAKAWAMEFGKKDAAVQYKQPIADRKQQQREEAERALAAERAEKELVEREVEIKEAKIAEYNKVMGSLPPEVLKLSPDWKILPTDYDASRKLAFTPRGLRAQLQDLIDEATQEGDILKAAVYEADLQKVNEVITRLEDKGRYWADQYRQLAQQRAEQQAQQQAEQQAQADAELLGKRRAQDEFAVAQIHANVDDMVQDMQSNGVPKHVTDIITKRAKDATTREEMEEAMRSATQDMRRLYNDPIIDERNKSAYKEGIERLNNLVGSIMQTSDYTTRSRAFDPVLRLVGDEDTQTKVLNNFDAIADVLSTNSEEFARYSLRNSSNSVTQAVDNILAALDDGKLQANAKNNAMTEKGKVATEIRDYVSYIRDVTNRNRPADTLRVSNISTDTKSRTNDIVTKYDSKGKSAEQLRAENGENNEALRENRDKKSGKKKETKKADKKSADNELLSEGKEDSPKPEPKPEQASKKLERRKNLDVTSSDVTPTDVQLHVIENGVPNTLAKLREAFGEKDPRGKVLDALQELFDDSFVVRFDNLENSNGYYDRATGEVVLNINSSEPDIDLIHELVHAYTHFAIDNAELMSPRQREAYDRLKRTLEIVQQDPELNAMNANLKGEDGMHEFVAEMASNPAFQNRVMSVLRQHHRDNLVNKKSTNKGIIGSLKQWWYNLGRLLGFNAKDAFNLRSLVEDTVSLFDRTSPTQRAKFDAEGRVLKREPQDNQRVKYMAYVSRSNEQNLGEEVVAHAVYDSQTKRWTLSWKKGDQVQEFGNLTYGALESFTHRNMLIPRRRSKVAPEQLWIEERINTADSHSGAFRSALLSIQKHLGPAGDGLARTLDRFAHWGVVNLNNRDSWITAIENIGRNVYGANIDEEVETRINALRQAGAAQINHPGVMGEQTLSDHIDVVQEIIARSGISKEKIEDMLYARRAPHFRRRKLRSSGLSDPYYKGKKLPDGKTISGFGYYVVDGKWSYTGEPHQWVADDDGSKFEAMLNPKEKAIMDELEKAIIAMNNNTLEFELQMGRIDKATFDDLYGEFYVPLMNKESEATAFTKRAKGRHSKAGELMAHYVANSKARINHAVESAIAREAADLLVQYPAPSIARLESSELVSRADTAQAIYQAEGLMDGTSVSFFRDGKRQRLALTDPIFKASLAKRSPTAKDTMTHNAILYLGKLTRYLSLTKTVFSPTFHAVSLIRDAGVGTVNYQAASRGKLSDAEARQLGLKHAVGMMKTVGVVARSLANPKKGDFRYRVFKNQGGINTMAKYDMDIVLEDFDKYAYNTDGFRAKAAKFAKGAMTFAHLTDDVGRMTAWLNYLEMKHGRPFASEGEMVTYLRANPDVANVARDISKNISTNFEQKGASNAPRALWIFWNASFGGMKTLYNMFNPKYGSQTAKNALLMAAVLVALEMGGAEDDDEEYPEWKQNNLGVNEVHIGGARIPLPQELYAPVNLLRNAMLVAGGKMTVEEATARSFRSLQESAFPFQTPQTDDTLFNMVYGTVPTLLQPVVSAGFNKDYFGRTLVPESGYDQEGNYIANPLDHQTARSGDSYLATMGSRALAQMFGIDTAPASWDLAFDTFGGGALQYVMGVRKAMAKGESPIEAAFAPFENRFSVKHNDYMYEQEADRLYREFMARQSIGKSLDELVNMETKLTRDEMTKWYTAQKKALKELALPGGRSTGKLLADKQRLTLAGESTMEIDFQLEELQKYRAEKARELIDKLQERIDRYEY